MKRAGILGLAIVSTLGLSVAATQATPNKVKVKSEVEIDDFGTPKEPDVTFFGDVTADKRKCVKGRKVKLRQLTDGIDAGADKTNRSGQWEVTFNGNEIPPGDFQATVKKRKVKQRKDGEVKKVYTCKKAVSPVFSVDLG